MIMKVEAKHRKLKGKISGIGLELIPVSQTEFRVTHWMEKIGLTKIIKPPIDFNKIKIEFIKSKSRDSTFLVIDLNHISYEICPRYPDLIPDKWKNLSGEYQMAERLPGSMAGNLTGRKFNIHMAEQVMVMSGPFGPVIPQDDNYIKIIGGPFANETMEFNTGNENITHQDVVFIPVKTIN